MRVDAVVLGGGDGAVIDPACRFKGLFPIGGKPMVEWVAEALLDAEMVQGISVVLPTAEELGPWVDRVDKLVVSDGSIMDNVMAGIDSFRVDRPVLLTTADLPLLDGAALDDFIRSSLATGSDFSYPVIRKEDILLQYPGTERTYVKLEGAHVTGGNMMIVDPALVRAARGLGERLFASRKSPLAMARVLGVQFIFKLLTGRLDVAGLEAKLGDLLGGSASAVYTHHASIGLDVDKASDVVLAERLLLDRAGERPNT